MLAQSVQPNFLSPFYPSRNDDVNLSKARSVRFLFDEIVSPRMTPFPCYGYFRSPSGVLPPITFPLFSLLLLLLAT